MSLQPFETWTHPLGGVRMRRQSAGVCRSPRGQLRLSLPTTTGTRELWFPVSSLDSALRATCSFYWRTLSHKTTPYAPIKLRPQLYWLAKPPSLPPGAAWLIEPHKDGGQELWQVLAGGAAPAGAVVTAAIDTGLTRSGHQEAIRIR